jgi:hypothetical protein
VSFGRSERDRQALQSGYLRWHATGHGDDVPLLEAFEKRLGIGMKEGMKAAMAQIDDVLAA